MHIKELIQNTDFRLSNSEILFDEPMSKYTSFKIGGPAECLIKVRKLEDLQKILVFAKNNNIKITIIGNGSNSLVLDGGIKGITIILKIDNISLDKKDAGGGHDDVIIKVDAGCKIAKLANFLLINEVTGFEELSGIPGTIGGAVKMNAGAHGKEMKEIIDEITFIDPYGIEKTIKNEDAKFDYRQSIFKEKDNLVIISAKLKLKKGRREIISTKMDEYTRFRRENQPIEYPNAGSTFKRGKDFITAKLIDEAGLKGYCIGDAEVSTKHSGFIINKGNAKAKDVLELVEYIKKEVFEKFEKKIELEIEVLGEE